MQAARLLVSSLHARVYGSTEKAREPVAPAASAASGASASGASASGASASGASASGASASGASASGASASGASASGFVSASASALAAPPPARSYLVDEQGVLDLTFDDDEDEEEEVHRGKRSVFGDGEARVRFELVPAAGAGRAAVVHPVVSDDERVIPSLYDLPCVQLRTNVMTTPAQIQRTLRMTARARTTMTRLMNETLAAYPFVVIDPTTRDSASKSAGWLTYAIEDVFANMFLGWAALGVGTFGAVVGACARPDVNEPGSGASCLNASGSGSASGSSGSASGSARHGASKKRSRAPSGAGAAGAAQPVPVRALYQHDELWEDVVRDAATSPKNKVNGQGRALTETGIRRLCAGIPMAMLLADGGDGGSGGSDGSAARGTMPMLAAIKIIRLEHTTLSLLKHNGNVVSTLAGTNPGRFGRVAAGQAVEFLNPGDTAFREVVAGFYANAMVATRATPHLACTYRALLLRGQTAGDSANLAYRRGLYASGTLDTAVPIAAVPDGTALDMLIAGEMCDLNLRHFVFALVMCTVSPAQKVLLLQTVLLQTLQAIAAMHATGNLRHNDVHAQNVMISFVPEDAVYHYHVPATREAGLTAYARRVVSDADMFSVPTHGVCAKLIDLGRCTGDVFSVGDSARAWANELNTPSAWIEGLPDIAPIKSAVHFDIGLLCASLRGTLKNARSIYGAEARDITALEHVVGDVWDLVRMRTADYRFQFPDAGSVHPPPSTLRDADAAVPGVSRNQLQTSAHPELGAHNNIALATFRALAATWLPPAAAAATDAPSLASRRANAFHTVVPNDVVLGTLPASDATVEALFGQVLA